jgi:hypothetical protein
MKLFVLAVTVGLSASVAQAQQWIPTSTSIPTLGELAMIGLAVAVGVVGGKWIGKQRK